MTSAWACWNDLEAIAALEWLKERHIAVPGRVTVIGIDDSVEALRHNLSSYNFNPQAVARAAVDHITADQGRGIVRKPGDVITQIGGMVIQRRSSAMRSMRD